MKWTKTPAKYCWEPDVEYLHDDHGLRIAKVTTHSTEGFTRMFDCRVLPNNFLGEYDTIENAKQAAEKLLK